MISDGTRARAVWVGLGQRCTDISRSGGGIIGYDSIELTESRLGAAFLAPPVCTGDLSLVELTFILKIRVEGDLGAEHNPYWRCGA